MKGTPKGRARRTASLVAMVVMVLSIMAPAATFANDDEGGNCPGGMNKLDDDPRGTFDLGDGVELTVTDSSVTVTGGSVVLCVKGGNANSGSVTLNDGQSYSVDFTNKGGNTPAISNVVIYEVNPTVVTEPEETDVCPNIEGDQAEVPEGYEMVDGECVLIEEEPTDVCPNLEGVQETVPDGMEVDDDGDCVLIEEEPTDVCPNLEGDQAEVPEGYEMVDGDCVEVDTGPDEVEQQMVTICHATASDTNPYDLITVSVNAIIGGGHGDHADDIIPSFEYTVDGETHVFPGQNWADGEAILAADCVVDTGPDEVDVCPNLEGDQAELPEGYRLVDGECVLLEVVCPEGSTLVGDVCVIDAVECPEGATLVDGVCVIDAVECPEGATLVDGVCVIDAVECPEGAELVDGVCVVDVVCPEGSTLIDGDCVIDAVECPEGTTLVDGVCVIGAVECPEGATLVDGVCVIDAVECPEGAELVDGVCVVDVVCPEGSTLTDGECVVDTVVGGIVVDRPDDGDDDGDADGEEVVVVVPSDSDTEVLGVTQTRTAQLAATGPATLPMLVLFSLLSLLFGVQLRRFGRAREEH